MTGNIYLIWINTDGEFVVSFLNNKLELVWETTLDQADGAIVTLLYDAFIFENNKLVVYGDCPVSGVGYFGVCYIITNDNNTISLTENSINNNISIYPNPANDNITVEADDITQVEIYNTVGQMVKRVGTNEDSVEVNVSAYNSGIYLMKITLSNGQTYSEKEVVR